MKSKLLLIYYFILLTIEILAELHFSYTNNPNYMFAIKPLLMPTLIVWAFLLAKDNKITLNKILIFALIFSMFGDISLMLLSINPDLFILGLIFFLIAHILYILLFLTAKFKNKVNLLKKHPTLLFICLSYGVTLILFLYTQQQSEFLEMQVPVIVYASVILLMLLTALSIYHKEIKSMKWIITGALLFVISDTTIALSKFSAVFIDQQNLARIIIMSLYGIAQFMIVKGYLLSTISHQQNTKNKLSEEST